MMGDPVLEAYSRQQGMIRAIASAAPEGSAVQLRFTSFGEGDDGSQIRIQLFGIATRQSDARRLARLMLAVFPGEIPLVAASAAQTAETLDQHTLANPQLTQVAEIRRDLDTVDPFLDLGLSELEYARPLLLPWAWSRQSMLGSLSLIREQPGMCGFAVHVEPRRQVSQDLIAFLETEARAYHQQDQASENTLIHAGRTAYRRWLRELPRSAVHLRTFLFSSEPLAAGLAEAVGVDLTPAWVSEGQYAFAGASRVEQPRDQTELYLALDLLEGVAPSWAVPEQPELAELLFLFEPYEASIPFRLPVTPLGGLPGITTSRLSGIPSGTVRRHGSSAATVTIGENLNGGGLHITLDELNRHVLVAGLPGFGKTTTVQAIVAQVHRDHGVPFLVIDPAKADYAALRSSCPSLNRVRLTPETPAFNPFATPAGVSPLSHGGRVLAAFDSALHLSTQSPGAWMILGRAIFRAYREAPVGRAPTMRSVFAGIGETIRRARYAPESSRDISAMLLGRIEYLTAGPLGDALMAASDGGIDWESLLATPTVVELQGFSGPQERALVFSLLMAGLVSYREAHPTPGRLSHVTVLEEAHRFLGVEGGVNEGVRLFADAIAELRGSGEGFVVVDQAPSTLHPSVNKITGSKIVHRIVDAHERVLVGTAMLLDPGQQGDLARLPPARAAVFTADSEGPTVVNVTAVTETTRVPELPDADTLAPGATVDPLYCVGCGYMCTGKAGARRAVSAADELRGLGPGERVVRAYDLTGSDPAGARCISARIAGLRAGSSVDKLHGELDVIDRTLATLRSRL